MHEGEEGDGDEDELGDRRIVGERHQGEVPARGADQRQAGLQQRHEEGENEGVVAELDDHRATFCPCVSCQWPDFFKAAATSGGM